MNTGNKTKSSELEKFQLFFEHQDDNRVVLTKRLQPVKRPRRHIASRR